MSKFNFTGLLAVVKALHETTTKHDTKAVIVTDKVKNDTTIEFKNGSYIKVLKSGKDCARSNRAKLYPAKRTCATCEHLAYNSDGSAECPLDWEHKCRPETQVMYKNKYE